MTLTLHTAGGSFELSTDYGADEVIAALESDHNRRLSFQLADGGVVEMRVALGCDWSLESHPDSGTAAA